MNRTLVDHVRGPRLEEVLPGLADDIARARARHEAPLYVQLAMAGGLLLAASLLTAGVSAFVGVLVVGLLGVLAGVASIVASRLSLPWFARPVVLLGAVAGRLGVATAIGGDALAPAMILVELTMLGVHRDPLNRVAATVLLVGWVIFQIPVMHQAIALACLLGGGAIVLTRPRWAGTRLASHLSPIATGTLAFALYAPSLGSEGWEWGLALLVGAATSVVSASLARRAGFGAVEVVCAAVFPIAIGLFTVPVPGVLVALAVALLAFVGRSRALWMAAMIALVLYGIRFYFELEWPLFAKGGAMVGVGVVFVAGGLLAGRSRG